MSTLTRIALSIAGCLTLAGCSAWERETALCWKDGRAHRVVVVKGHFGELYGYDYRDRNGFMQRIGPDNSEGWQCNRYDMEQRS